MQTLYRLVRPRDRETIASKALAASNWDPTTEPVWHQLRHLIHCASDLR